MTIKILLLLAVGGAFIGFMLKAESWTDIIIRLLGYEPYSDPDAPDSAWVDAGMNGESDKGHE